MRGTVREKIYVCDDIKYYCVFVGDIFSYLVLSRSLFCSLPLLSCLPLSLPFSLIILKCFLSLSLSPTLFPSFLFYLRSLFPHPLPSYLSHSLPSYIRIMYCYIWKRGREGDVSFPLSFIVVNQLSSPLTPLIFSSPPPPSSSLSLSASRPQSLCQRPS